MERTEIAVVGAGVIGLTVALRLLDEGREVVLIDPAEPGAGASYGNAGVIADYAVLPVGTPEVLRRLPALMFDRDSPLAIRRAALPALAPWLLRFLRQSLPGRARANAAALAALLGRARAGWEALAADLDAGGLLRRSGCLYLFLDRAELGPAAADRRARAALGVEAELLSASGVAALEPALPPAAGGLFFPGVASLSDPGLMMRLLAETVAERGARFVSARATGLARDGRGAVVTGPGLRLAADRVVLAAGAHARALARAAGDAVPLDTERGYHLEWDMEAALLSRPVCPAARGFYLSPMAGRLRAAGTVELGGLSAPPSPHRLARIEAGARAVFPGLGTPARSWMGFRPSLPDSLPVIGPSRGGAEVIHAFGHGHLGVTLAPVTAAIVADLVAGRAPGVPLAAVSPARF